MNKSHFGPLSRCPRRVRLARGNERLFAGADHDINRFFGVAGVVMSSKLGSLKIFRLALPKASGALTTAKTSRLRLKVEAVDISVSTRHYMIEQLHQKKRLAR